MLRAHGLFTPTTAPELRLTTLGLSGAEAGKDPELA